MVSERGKKPDQEGTSWNGGPKKVKAPYSLIGKKRTASRAQPSPGGRDFV